MSQSCVVVRAEPRCICDCPAPEREGHHAGAVVGVRLEDLDGNVIATGRWGTPMGTNFDHEGEHMPVMNDRFTLPIPEQYRGELLRFSFFPLKWMPWQIHGLDEPWLGRTPEAFE